MGPRHVGAATRPTTRSRRWPTVSCTSSCFGEKLRGPLRARAHGPQATAVGAVARAAQAGRAAVTGWDPEDHPRSVLSGRDNDEVAADRDRVWDGHGEAGAAAAVPDGFAPPRPRSWLRSTRSRRRARGRCRAASSSSPISTRCSSPRATEASTRHQARARPLLRARWRPWILPYLADRPLNLHRFPDGVTRKGFWQKQAPKYAPDVDRAVAATTEADADESHRLPRRWTAPPGLAWLANHAAVELHPWTSKIPEVAPPDVRARRSRSGRGHDAGTTCSMLARLHRTALEHLGVRGYPKTTGQRGLQIWIPIEPGSTFDETREWVRAAVARGRRRRAGPGEHEVGEAVT